MPTCMCGGVRNKAPAHALPGWRPQHMQHCCICADICGKHTTPVALQMPSPGGLVPHLGWFGCPRWRRPPAAPPLCSCGHFVLPRSRPSVLRVLQHPHHSPPTISPRTPKPNPTLTLSTTTCGFSLPCVLGVLCAASHHHMHAAPHLLLAVLINMQPTSHITLTSPLPYTQAHALMPTCMRGGGAQQGPSACSTRVEAAAAHAALLHVR